MKYGWGLEELLEIKEQYLKHKGFTIDVIADQSFLIGLVGLLDLYISYLPHFTYQDQFPFKRILLEVDNYVSILLPNKYKLTIKMIAKKQL